MRLVVLSLTPDISRIFLYLYPHTVASHNTNRFMSLDICRLIVMVVLQYHNTTWASLSITRLRYGCRMVVPSLIEPKADQKIQNVPQSIYSSGCMLRHKWGAIHASLS